MNKKELVEKVAVDAGISKRAAYRAVSSVFDRITQSMKRENVTLAGFGTFGMLKRKARFGYNLQTGKKHRIRAKKTPHFKPSRRLNEKLGK